MGRLAALSIFSAIGFTIGFLGYLAHPMISTWISGPLVSQGFIGAIASGMAGLVASFVLVTRWAKKP